MFRYPSTYIFIGIGCGIILQKNLFLTLAVLIPLLIIGFLLFVFFHFKPSKLSNFGIVFSIFFTSLLLGSVIYKIQTHRPENHISNLKTNQKIGLKVKPIYALKSSNYYRKYVAEVVSAQKDSLFITTSGKVLIQSKVEDSLELEKPNYYYVLGNISTVKPSLNPYGFEYDKYLANKHIFTICKADTIIKKESVNQWVSHSKYYTFLLNNIDNSKLSLQAKETLKALTLGHRIDLSKETANTLSLSGIIHIFAISGLHIGLLFAFFYKTFLFILGRKRESIAVILSLIILYAYGGFIDFPVSVVRALLMLSFYYGFVLFKRPSLNFHSLAIAGILMLLYNPLQIFEVGFQLSFTAVFFIFWLYKPIVNCLPQYKFSSFINPLLAITFSAQMGTLPLSVFYFHQYSLGSFFLNLLVVPLAGILVIVSFLTLFFISCFPNLQEVISLYNYMVEGLFYLAEKSISRSAFYSKNISITWIELIFIYVVILFVRTVFKRFSLQKILFLCVFVALFQLSRLGVLHFINAKEEFIVFHEYKNTVMGLKKGNTFTVLSADSLSDNFKNYGLRNCILHYKNPMLKTVVQPVSEIEFSEQKIVIIDSEYISKTDKNDVVIIRNSPKINFTNLLVMSCKIIVVDGSNYPNYAQKLKQFFREHKSEKKLWITSEKGFYKVEL